MSEDLDALLPDVYDAALGAVKWEAVLPRVVRFLGAQRGGFGARIRGSEAGFLLFHNLDEDLVTLWVEEFGGYDPWVENFGDRRQVGEILHGGSEPFLAEMRTKPVYHAFYDPLGADDLLAIPVSRHGSSLSYVAGYRSRQEGLFDDEDRHRAHLLSPHMVRAAAIQERIGGLGEVAAAARAVLEAVPYGVLVLGERGELLWANATGERVLRGGSGLSLRAGVVRVRDARIDAGLVSANPEISIVRTADGRRLEMLVLPLGPRAGDSTFSFTGRRAALALLIADPAAENALAPDSVGKVLKLPPSLARLAAAIGSGSTVAKYAEQTGLSEGTARQQLKDVLARAGVSRQAELVRLLQRSVAALPVGD